VVECEPLRFGSIMLWPLAELEAAVAAAQPPTSRALSINHPSFNVNMRRGSNPSVHSLKSNGGGSGSVLGRVSHSSTFLFELSTICGIH
jgi:hypothetical protein